MSGRFDQFSRVEQVLLALLFAACSHRHGASLRQNITQPDRLFKNTGC
jgi:hypothetical protein